MEQFITKGKIEKVGQLQNLPKGQRLKITIQRKFWNAKHSLYQVANQVLILWDEFARDAVENLQRGSEIKASGIIHQRHMYGRMVTWRNVREITYLENCSGPKQVQMELPF